MEVGLISVAFVLVGARALEPGMGEPLILLFNVLRSFCCFFLVFFYRFLFYHERSKILKK